MAIQDNQIDRFTELLLPTIGWFIYFRRKNYANGCELFLLSWKSWIVSKNPIVDYLRLNFKACSEEYGESAIHNLMVHIRENNYAENNMKLRWLESSTASWCFKYSKSPRSHKVTGTKWFTETNAGDLIVSVIEKLDEICKQIETGDHFPFVPHAIGYKSDCERCSEPWIWDEFLTNIQSRDLVASIHCTGIQTKLEKHLDSEALNKIDVGLLF
jgi:hypothetical protein